VKGVRESIFWLLTGVSVILLMALLSYHPQDPSFSVVGDSESVTNRMGPAGAWFADLAFLILGVSAYLLPALVLLGSFYFFREQRIAATRNAKILRGTGFGVVVMTSSGLATLHFEVPGLRETAGGLLGQGVGLGLEVVLGMLGATLLLLVLWFAAVSVATGISWLAIMDYTGRGVLAGITEINIAVNQVKTWLAGRRAKQERHELVTKSRSKLKIGPRIEPTLEKVEISARTERERQVPLFEPPAATEVPPLSLLDDAPAKEGGYSAEALEAMSRLVELKLADFGIEVEVVAVHPGPVVTRF
jgi:S-DNA-T family DNA segregation ATPase FtsK/SpoIIIE